MTKRAYDSVGRLVTVYTTDGGAVTVRLRTVGDRVDLVAVCLKCLENGVIECVAVTLRDGMGM